jgi:hypothetical protein
MSTWQFGSQSWLAKRSGPNISLGPIGPFCPSTDVITEMPRNPAGIKLRDIEVDVDRIGQPAGIARRALSPNEIVIPLNETFSSATGLSVE